MKPATISQQLATFAWEISGATLPTEVRRDIAQRILDTLGICIAASAQGVADGVADVIGHAGGRPESTIIGRSDARPAAQAALHNGTLAHSLDFDDTHLPSVLHPSATIVPAALAVAESSGAGGRALIEAIAVGIEITVRVGMGGYLAAKGNQFFERGWHATSICGTVGAAASAAKLFGLNPTGIAHAIGIATSFGSGLIEGNRVGGTVKRLHCGWAAHSGILAAQLAARGYTAPLTAFEGRFGFYRAFVDGHFDASAVVNDLGARWEGLKTHFKPYPVNHYVHTAIDAALAIRANEGFDPARIDAIELGSSRPALRTIGEPRASKIRPESGYHARFSGPFAVAAALLGGSGLGVGLDDFSDERARDPRYLALAAKVATFVDAECDAIFPNAFASVVRVHFSDGITVEERVMENLGGPQRPLTEAALRRKFLDNASAAFERTDAERLAGAILRLDESEEIAVLTDRLRRCMAPRPVLA